MGRYIIGIDQSTQGTKALLVDEGGHLIHRADRSHRQIVNEAGWVSHDPAEIAANVLAVALIRVPGAWLLSNAYSDTLFPMGIASPCGSILSAAICVIAFIVLNRRGTFDKLMA